MATQETLYSGQVTDIAKLVEACKFPPDAYVLVEWQPNTIIKDEDRQNLLRFVRLKDVIGEKGFNIASYTSGRVFNDEFELRWEQNAVTQGQTSVVYLGVERELPGELKHKATAQHDGNERKYYLFGERLDAKKQNLMSIKPPQEYEYYAETRVPRLLLYPKVKEAEQYERLQAVTREYRLSDPKTGSEIGSAYRFLNLIPVDRNRVEKEA